MDTLSCVYILTLNDDIFQDQHPLSFKAKSDPDSMYYHQAMKQPDKHKFIESIKGTSQSLQRQELQTLSQKETT